MGSFLFTAVLILRWRVRERRRNWRGKLLRLIQNRLATPSLAKITPASQTNSPQAEVADSSSKSAVNFSSAGTTKRFPSPRCASGIQTRRMTTRSEMYFPGLHPAQKIPLRPCNTLGVFSPLGLDRNLQQIPNQLISGVPELIQVTGRQGPAKA